MIESVDERTGPTIACPFDPVIPNTPDRWVFFVRWSAIDVASRSVTRMLGVELLVRLSSLLEKYQQAPKMLRSVKSKSEIRMGTILPP
jgi:hypothetical protein